MPPSDLHKTKRKKNLVVFGLVLLIMALIWAVTMIKIAKNAQAEELDLTDVEACGVPVSGDLDTQPSLAVCDIYTRQIEFAKESENYRENIAKRQEAFARPRRAAMEQYKQSLETYQYPDDKATEGTDAHDESSMDEALK